MSYRPRIPTLDEHYCQVCSSTSNNTNKYLACFTCDHCGLAMCYECFEKHTSQLIGEYSQLQKRFSKLTNLLDDKRQFFEQFQDHCMRSVNAVFDEAINDLENLRYESINYVRKEFNDAEIIISELMAKCMPLITKSQENWSRNGITKNVMVELELQQKQINDIEHRLEMFSSPNLQIKMSTYPRNNLDLQCQLLLNSYKSTNTFSHIYPGKTIVTRCSCSKDIDLRNDKIDVETQVEELIEHSLTNKQIQTDPVIDPNLDTDDDDDGYNDIDSKSCSLLDESEQINNRINNENCLSTRFIQQGTIFTQNEVDRIASDGEHLLYYSDTSKSLCYITNIESTRQANGTSTTNEITCRWPHQPIIDLIYSPGSSQFLCATKTGVYTCTIKNSKIDIKMQLVQLWTYVRISADQDAIWLWSDTPRTSQLRKYSPITFDCIRIYDLKDYPRFLDNSTSFCVQTNTLATLFQFNKMSSSLSYRKIFHLTLCDIKNLQELCTIHLGECDIDHEIRHNNDGLFFITNGRKKLWIVDHNGKKEYVKLYRTGRALALHNKNHIIIANGTQQLQCVELLQDDNGII
ncbi:unnamed protein product [Adineta steineri]|uniref:Uncharacterized protein n=1 Tax=Adineta steineri TaxID=433720 RepID=A0A818YL59_9BILA|nr:unnamed protein product [Adineta steineri]CAF3755729.1 unnamed protein product [Adineta steineri]